jgi:hypothetical protein
MRQQLQNHQAQRPAEQSRPAMRRLIWSQRRRCFLTSNGEWTRDTQRAAVLPDYFTARQTAESLRLRDARYYRFEDPRYDFSIELG